MHDNLTNSRGNSRIQQDYEQQFQQNPQSRNTGSGIGMQSPPNLPGQQIIRQNNNNNGYKPESQHFMQDAIERKIEKFSSQNINVQKRVSTSSKFRNNNNNSHMMIGGPQISANHGPGSSGGQGQNQNPMKQKKYSLNDSQGPIQINQGDYYLSQGQNQNPLGGMKNQQLKRPNTIANKGPKGQSGNGQQFDINGIKLQMDQNMPLSQGTMGMGSFERQPEKQQPIGSSKNMSEIYDMLEKYNAQGKDDYNRQSPPILSKDQIVFSMK